MTKKYRFDGLWLARIVFGLVIPLPFVLIYSVLAVIFLAPGLFVAGPALQERLIIALFLLWTSAGWMGLAAIFSILKRKDYSSRTLNLWQIIGLVAGIIAASPWVIIVLTTVTREGAIAAEDVFFFSLAGPIIVAVVCLIKLKWQIRKNQVEAGQPSA